jgi:hypothetical protein
MAICNGRKSQISSAWRWLLAPVKHSGGSNIPWQTGQRSGGIRGPIARPLRRTATEILKVVRRGSYVSSGQQLHQTVNGELINNRVHFKLKPAHIATIQRSHAGLFFNLAVADNRSAREACPGHGRQLSVFTAGTRSASTAIATNPSQHHLQLCLLGGLVWSTRSGPPAFDLLRR